MNILEDASSLRYGCLVHYYRVCGVSAFRVDTQPILQWGRLFTWREGVQASRLTDAIGKGGFRIILFKTHRFFHAR